VKYWLELIAAIPIALLPKRYWQSINMPVDNVAFASAIITMFAGFALGIRGYFAYLAVLYSSPGASILEISKRQVTGELPETAAVSGLPMTLGILAPITFALATPVGLAATYLVLTGLIRSVGSYIGEPHGDPILTGIDTLARRTFTSQRQRAARHERARLEGADEPDRRYEGTWAGLTGVEFVVVSARRKPGWTPGTWIITSDGWFKLGEPFDRPMPQGVRTIYPLTVENSLDVLRKGVSYELPPLRKARAKETASPPVES
jgi:hypothetical protein